MKPWMTLGVVAILLAGCTSSNAPPSPASSSGTTTATTSAPGGITTYGAPVRHDVGLNFTGQTPIGGCVFSIQSACEFQGGNHFEQRLQWVGDPVSLVGDVTLGGTGQVTNVQAILFLGDSSQAPIAGGPGAFSSGPSPLHFEMNLTSYTGHLTLGIYSAEGEGAPIGFAFANVPQDFTVTANLHSLERKQVNATA